MTYVVYDTDTTIEVGRYATWEGAKRRRDKINAEWGMPWVGVPKYEAVYIEFYRLYIVHTKTVRNLLSGKTAEEPSNLPYYLSVSSETYWSS